MIDYVADGILLASFILAVCTVVTAAVSAFYYGRGGNRNYFIPGMRCQSLLFYCSCMTNLHSQARKNVPALCLILQYFCGLCKMFERDRIARFWILNRSFVFFFKPETVEVVLNSPVEIEKSSEYHFLHPWLGTGLLTSKGDKWRFRRKLLTPSFHFRILDEFLPIFDEQSRLLVSKLSTMTAKPWVDIVPLINLCTLDIICQTAMGVTINVQLDGFSEYVKAIYDIVEIFLYRQLRPWLWIDAIFYHLPAGRNFKANLQLVHSFTRKVIKEKKQEMLENYPDSQSTEKDLNDSPSATKKRRAFLELLLEHHLADNSLTEEDIREEVDTFMFAGYDTTSMAICWTLYNLGLHPQVQEDVHKELDSIFEDDVLRPITRDDLAQMKYLECVIKESLRLYPSVPFFGRELTEDIKVLDYKVCSGSVCFIIPFMLHRDPESFPNPEKFDPERFFPENCYRRHPYAYVPFSAGPRNCIGQKYAVMEVKAILANVLRHFRVESLDERDKVNLLPGVVIRNVDPLRMRILKRQ